jgi:hypothetical protein
MPCSGFLAVRVVAVIVLLVLSGGRAARSGPKPDLEPDLAGVCALASRECSIDTSSSLARCQACRLPSGKSTVRDIVSAALVHATIDEPRRSTPRLPTTALNEIGAALHLPGDSVTNP